MDKNQIAKPEIEKASELQIEEMNTIVSKIVQLIKNKHL
jgi:hypothetical protein